ncbi:hypothetical protein pclt_cds_108 [Pandoravirus celtis]|uniref:DUF5678 domain-containing protein n=1 Tax=Pandoravirus celtis TaxID=2568002 RepID=A0A4D6EFS1_9VIRU|nr:hypothetical protein pclt_cds_108 [Pandoravirus celtis]
MSSLPNPPALEQELHIIRHQGPLPDPSPQFKRQVEYYEAHKQELMERLPGQWICIDDERVVESAPTEDQLVARLLENGPRPQSLMVCVEPGNGTVFIG